MSTIQGLSQALQYYNSVASEFVDKLDTNQTYAGKTAITNLSNKETYMLGMQERDFVDAYQPTMSSGNMSASLAMAQEKSKEFINQFAEAANMFDALMISQQKTDTFIDSFLQSSEAADSFVDKFLAYSA